ncbi:MAG: U32 family peptidase [Bacteroidetes bacterium]|nr:U32 family peptidase [Bacteroidota bacterium]MCL2302650.1 U32 family peptidase [Lentimicrobiaceae bacterium]
MHINKRKIELLAPAKNVQCGKEAILHGADAIYMGAPKFSARSAAGNSIADIAELCTFAHQYGAAVHVALNTILTDSELVQAEKIIWQLYESKIDALIIQDFGILKLDLPPIPLHASTQCDNRTADHVKMLEQLGFQRVILARELSLNEIKQMKAQTCIELEAFVHGALCVSYSGQCYASEACMKRSANRGACAQLCRLPYKLLDSSGNEYAKGHLLSLKDLNRSEYLEEMMIAGISSFKIEGRLKDVNYVKNITAYYHQKLEEILQKNDDFTRTSYGKTSLFFTPNPEKSFHRGSTNYFLSEREAPVHQWHTPKSTGEYIGVVEKSEYNYFTYSGKLLHNDDGVVIIDEESQEVYKAFKINAVEENRVFPAEKVVLAAGQLIYRNYDYLFENQLKKTSSQRKIEVKMCVEEIEEGFVLHLSDERGASISQKLTLEKVIAEKKEEAKSRLQNELLKTGNTIYQVVEFEDLTKESYFIPASVMANWRREAIALLDEKETLFSQSNLSRKKGEGRKETLFLKGNPSSYLQNVHNEKAAAIYRELGVNDVVYSFEKQPPKEEVAVMFCKYCIKKALGCCSQTQSEPLFLESESIRFRLDFDCDKCEMRLHMKPFTILA